MTPNTSPKKPEWFSMIENEAPSARVRKVDKKLPAATALAALAIVAAGTFFANGSLTSESPTTSALATSSGANPVENSVNDSVSTLVANNLPAGTSQISSVAANTKLAAPQSANTITDPTLNGGGGDDDDRDDEDEDEDDRDDEDDDDRD
jgi:hypothetical protein